MTSTLNEKDRPNQLTYFHRTCDAISHNESATDSRGELRDFTLEPDFCF